jgi:hypothetical protein
LAILLSCAAAAPSRADADVFVDVDFFGTELDTALQRLSLLAGVQVLYEQAVVSGRRSPAVSGHLPVSTALERLLHGSGLTWRFIDGSTVVIFQRARSPAHVQAKATPVAAAARAPGEFTDLDDVEVTAGRRAPINPTSTSAFGFEKSLVETPRSITSIGEDTIEAFGLSAVEDLAGVAPGIFTTTRFGIQGSVDVRSVPADTYFRGMKRLTLQGHGRSVLAALDSIEVVGGPPSPLYGMGKIGGYTNVYPKSGRAQSGKYLTEVQGFVQAIGGEYQRRELSFGVGGPVPALQAYGRRAGYYVYGLAEDSNTYVENVPVRQKLLQAASSVDDFLGSFRLETGINVQESRTAGALLGRLTQDVVDTGRYIGGAPLVNLDLNRDGAIDFSEFNLASPIKGRPGAGNQPLAQYFAWPKGPDGKPFASLADFPKVPGIPKSMYDYLVAHPESDPTGLLRAQGVGGPLPISGAVPVGLTLDPSTVRFSTLNPRHASAYERESKAKFFTAYADLVRDQDPGFLIRNQLFFDSMNQYKLSDQPLHQIQNVNVFEDRFTITHRLVRLPGWLRVDSLFSANLRTTLSSGATTTGFSDFGNHRSDAAAPDWNAATSGMTPNSTFDPLSFPFTSIYRTSITETGAGALLDIDTSWGTNLIVGGRYDASHARNTDLAGRFDVGANKFNSTDDTAAAWDDGSSWTFSISQALFGAVHPYATLSRSSVLLDGNNNSLTNAVIRAGHVGAARLREAGIKASLLQGKMLLAGSLFEQGRSEVEDDSDAALINAYATATTTRGSQAELRWSPQRNLMLTLYALHQSTEYTPNIGGPIQIDARALGFRDVVDATGRVIYPADAFLYGGRVRIVLPDGLPAYRRKQGNPDRQAGMSAIYQFANGTGLTIKANYLSSTCSGRLCLVALPASQVYDASIFRTSRHWDVKLAIYNLTDERYFRARTGDVLGDVIGQAMPGRRWQATIKYKF